MKSSMKWAYRALKIHDMADAAMAKLPAAIIETGLFLAGWLLLGGAPVVGLYVMAGLAAVSLALFTVFLAATGLMRLLGYTEVGLERLGLA